MSFRTVKKLVIPVALVAVPLLIYRSMDRESTIAPSPARPSVSGRNPRATVAPERVAAQGPLATPSLPQAQPAQEPSPLRLDGETLSVHVRHWTLGQLADALSRLLGIEVICPPELNDQLISDDFSNLPLQPALQRLFGQWDSFQFFKGSNRGPKLAAIWLYARGQGQQMQPVPPELWASTREIEANLAAVSPALRSAALDSLAERSNGPEAAQAALQALADTEESVRLRALDTVLNFGLALPLDTLAALTDDPADEIRIRALEVLRFLHTGNPADSATVNALLERAGVDASEAVRKRARALSQELAPRRKRREMQAVGGEH